LPWLEDGVSAHPAVATLETAFPPAFINILNTCFIADFAIIKIRQACYTQAWRIIHNYKSINYKKGSLITSASNLLPLASISTFEPGALNSTDT